MLDELSASLAATVQAARVAQDLSVNALAERSGVSRAMIGKIERGEAQPTAVLLGRLSGALGMTLSELAAQLDQSAATMYRVLATLERRALVEINADRQEWYVGAEAYRLGSACVAGNVKNGC